VLIPQNIFLIILNSYYYLFYLDLKNNFSNWKKKVKKDYHKFIEHSLLINLTFHLFWLEFHIDYSHSYSIGLVLFLPFLHVLYFIYQFSLSYFNMMKNSWGRYYCRNCIFFLFIFRFDWFLLHLDVYDWYFF
jgi:hypothetical protein